MGGWRCGDRLVHRLDVERREGAIAPRAPSLWTSNHLTTLVQRPPLSVLSTLDTHHSVQHSALDTHQR
jgi:hypothetical protein